MLFPILITLLSKGVEQLRELLGEGHEVLDSPQNPPLVCWGGWLITRSFLFSFTPSFTYFHLSNCSQVHAFIHFLTHSLISSLPI
jgi:hypothetical protein